MQVKCTKEAKKSLEGLRERLDKILKLHKEREFIEVVGRVGGDVEVYRVYNDGMVCMK